MISVGYYKEPDIELEYINHKELLGHQVGKKDTLESLCLKCMEYNRFEISFLSPYKLRRRFSEEIEFFWM